MYRYPNIGWNNIAVAENAMSQYLLACASSPRLDLSSETLCTTLLERLPCYTELDIAVRSATYLTGRRICG